MSWWHLKIGTVTVSGSILLSSQNSPTRTRSANTLSLTGFFSASSLLTLNISSAASTYSALLATVNVQLSYCPYGLNAAAEACLLSLSSRSRNMLPTGVPEAPPVTPVYAETSDAPIFAPIPVKAMNTASIRLTFSRPRGMLVSSMKPLLICLPSFIWKYFVMVLPSRKQSSILKLVRSLTYLPKKWKYGFPQRSIRSTS